MMPSQGVTTRASLDNHRDGDVEAPQNMKPFASKFASASNIEPGRIILGVADQSIVDVFKQQARLV